MNLYHCEILNLSITTSVFPEPHLTAPVWRKHGARPVPGMKRQALFCMHQCCVCPLNNCRVTGWKKTLMLPFLTRAWNGSRQSKKACWVHLFCQTNRRIHREAWITPHLPRSPPVAALHVCSLLWSTDQLCFSSAPSSSCLCIEDCCTGACKILHRNF